MSTTVCASLSEVPAGWFLADCAVSGGDLRRVLTDLLRLSEGKLCVRLEPVYMDFPLPCPSGVGAPLTAEQLRRLRREAPCHFSPALCTEYFTLVRDGRAHVILFDTDRSLKEKYRLLEETGVPMALVEDETLRSKL